MRYGSLPGSAPLDRQPSAGYAAIVDSDSNSELYMSAHPNGLTVSTRPALTQRQSSDDLPSTSYAQAPGPKRSQHRSSSHQPSSPQVIDLDDSPLPVRQRGSAKPATNRGLPSNHPDCQDSGALVDLTGDSSPVTHVPMRRPADRVNLESIGSHLLRRTSSDLSSHQDACHNGLAQASSLRHPSGNHTPSLNIHNSRTLYSTQSALPSATASTPAAGVFNDAGTHEAGDFLDLSQWHSSQFGSATERPDLLRPSRALNGDGMNASRRRAGAQQHRYNVSVHH